MKQTKGLNPFLPFSTYVPDGEPKVFGDRLYLYGSFDLFNRGYCCNQYHVFSCPVTDFSNWTDHGVSFTTDEVPWSNASLYAPDALFYKGRYYLYFCLSDGTEGVAESDRPEGPFKNARQITSDGEPITGIDPSVLEDDGHIYYTWGQFHLNVAELNEDLCSLKPETVHTDVLSNAPGREGFHEGSSLRKIGGNYCLIYASEYTDDFPNSGSRPTKLDYAVSDTPYGVYERRGTIIDNDGCDPATWNNHGSVIQSGKCWFVFYHASSNNSAFSRRARAERLIVDARNCLINKTTPSTNGFIETLLPEHINSPVNACKFFGGAFVTQTEDGRFPCVGLREGAGFRFSPILFRDDNYMITVRYRSKQEFTLRVSLDTDFSSEASFPASDQLRLHTLRVRIENGEYPLIFEISQSQDLPECEIDMIEIIPEK